MPVIVVLVPVIVVLVAVIVVLMPVVVVLVPVIVAAVILFFFTPPLRATGAYRGGTAEQKQEHPDSHFPMAHAAGARAKEHALVGICQLPLYYANCPRPCALST